MRGGAPRVRRPWAEARGPCRTIPLLIAAGAFLAPGTAWALGPPEPDSLLAPAPGTAEPDPVIAMGLFPLGESRTVLSIESERIDVRVRPFVCRVRRTYRIRCEGPDRTDTLACALLGPDYLSSGIGRNVRATVDGASAPLQFRSGLLLDRGASVALAPVSEWEILDCWQQNVEGDICGHTWAQFPAKFRKGRTREVVLEYDYTAGPEGSLEFAVQALRLYSEKFWASGRIRRVEVRLEPRDWNQPLDRFRPRTGAARIAGAAGAAPRPYKVSGEALVWEERGYRPNQRHGAVVELVDPASIDSRAILEALQKRR